MSKGTLENTSKPSTELNPVPKAMVEHLRIHSGARVRFGVPIELIALELLNATNGFTASWTNHNPLGMLAYGSEPKRDGIALFESDTECYDRYCQRLYIRNMTDPILNKGLPELCKAIGKPELLELTKEYDITTMEV